MGSSMVVREQTFDGVCNDTPLLDLPIVFEGDIQQCNEYCRNREGFIWKPSSRILVGGYFYNREDSVALLIT